MSWLDVLGRGAAGVGRGVLGGVEDIGRGLLGGGQSQGPQFDLTKLQPLMGDPQAWMTEAIRQAALSGSPSASQMLGGLGQIPVLGPVLGTGLQVLSAVQAARHGGLGREIMARGIANQLPWERLPEIALTGQRLQGVQTEKAQTEHAQQLTQRVIGQKGIDRELANSQLAVDQSLKDLRGAQTATEQAQAHERYVAAWKHLEDVRTARGALDVVPTPQNTQVVGGPGGRVITTDPRTGRAYDLGQQGASGAGGAYKPPPVGIMTSEQADQEVAARQGAGQRAIKRLATGRVGPTGEPLYEVTAIPEPVITDKRRQEAYQRLGALMGEGLTNFAVDFRTNSLKAKEAEDLIRLITGRPIPLKNVLDQEGRIDQGKIDRAVREGQLYDKAIGLD